MITKKWTSYSSLVAAVDSTNKEAKSHKELKELDNDIKENQITFEQNVLRLAEIQNIHIIVLICVSICWMEFRKQK